MPADDAARPSLRHFDPGAPRRVIYRVCVRLASTHAAIWLAQKPIWAAVVWRIDPYLLRLSRGRVSTGLLLPTALLQTRGATPSSTSTTAPV
jgi:hypothetical protein